MTQPAADGLLALKNKRAAARRGAPSRIKPSQNPNTLPPYTPPTGAGLPEPTREESTDSPAADVSAVEQRTPAGGQDNVAATSTAATTVAPPAARVRGTTAYLDEPHKAYLRRVAIEGLSRSDKIDVSSSAVIRFALDQVMREMAPEQVYAAIAAKPVDPNAIGRKRR